jgi:DNA-directed RNA polymerase subunit RPC12/RpoP
MKHVSLKDFFRRHQFKGLLALLALLMAAALLLPAQKGVAGADYWKCPTCGDTAMGWSNIPNDDGTHTPRCDRCDNEFGAVFCSGGTATCTVKAKCTSCGQFYGDYAAHQYLPSGTAPNCWDSGTMFYTCSLCKYTYSSQLPALGHDYKAAVTTSTCTAVGKIVYTCARCRDTYTTTQFALGHDYKAAVTAPTCTAEGKTVYTCARCADTYTTTQPALGHNLRYDAGRSKAPACVVKGLEAYTCARCGQRQDKVLPWLVHRYGAWAPDGEGHTAACVVCGEPKTVPCEFTEHKVGDAALRLCGVCGQGSFGNQAFTAPMVENASYNRLRLSYAPKNGELVVRRLALPGSADALYIVLLEVGGVSVPTTGAVRVTLPVAGEGTFALAQLGADMTPDEIPFTQQEGNLVFDAYLPGLFLLQAAGK